MPDALSIAIFHGQLSVHTAHVYARVNGVPGGQEWTIQGRVRGPECRFARTLPTTYALTDLGPGENLLARVTIPDPCFWSPDLPSLYRVTLEVRLRGEVVQTLDRELGIRFLGARGNSFYLEGKRWVLRGVHRDLAEETSLAAWRDVGAAMVVDHPSDELCRETSRAGVLLVARPRTMAREDLQRLAPWGSVAFVVGDGRQANLRELQQYAPNTILVDSDATERRDPLVDSESAVMPDVARAGLEAVGQLARHRPTIGLRILPGLQTLSETRSACDQLQCDLAPFGDCAGYVVDIDPCRLAQQER